MRIVVTGGAGFIGSHIVDALVERGHHVAAIDDLSSGRRENVNAGARLHVVDVASPELATVMERERPDVVIHQAAQMSVRRSVADPQHDATVNIVGGLNVYQSCVRLGVKKVLFASSGGCVYGDQESLPSAETSRPRPESPYGIAKYANEHYLRYYYGTHGLPSVSLRYANVYGPRQNPLGEAGVVAIFASQLLSGETPTIFGTGEQTRDYVYVGDVVAANLAALDYDGTGILNVGTGVETNVNELYERIRTLLGSSVSAKRGDPIPGEQMRSVVDVTRAKQVLNWEPTTPLEKGLGETLEWFRTNRTS